jgi:hypothetical protein
MVRRVINIILYLEQFNNYKGAVVVSSGKIAVVASAGFESALAT